MSQRKPQSTDQDEEPLDWRFRVDEGLREFAEEFCKHEELMQGGARNVGRFPAAKSRKEALKRLGAALNIDNLKIICKIEGKFRRLCINKMKGLARAARRRLGSSGAALLLAPDWLRRLDTPFDLLATAWKLEHNNQVHPVEYFTWGLYHCVRAGTPPPRPAVAEFADRHNMPHDAVFEIWERLCSVALSRLRGSAAAGDTPRGDTPNNRLDWLLSDLTLLYDDSHQVLHKSSFSNPAEVEAMLHLYKLVTEALRHTDTQHTDSQHTDTQHTDSQLTDTQHTDSQHTDTQLTATQHIDTQHTDTQLTDTQHTDSQHTDTQLTATQHIDTQHTDTQLTDTQHTDSQLTDTQQTDSQHTDTQLTATQHIDTQHTDTQLTDTQHTDSQLTDTQQTDKQNSESQHTADAPTQNREDNGARQGDNNSKASDPVPSCSTSSDGAEQSPAANSALEGHQQWESVATWKWIHAEYCKHREASLVTLQKRWYELKQLARRGLLLSFRDPGQKPHPLLLAIVKRFPSVVTSPLPAWSELVQRGCIHTDPLCFTPPERSEKQASSESTSRPSPPKLSMSEMMNDLLDWSDDEPEIIDDERVVITLDDDDDDDNQRARDDDARARDDKLQSVAKPVTVKTEPKDDAYDEIPQETNTEDSSKSDDPSTKTLRDLLINTVHKQIRPNTAQTNSDSCLAKLLTDPNVGKPKPNVGNNMAVNTQQLNTNGNIILTEAEKVHQTNQQTTKDVETNVENVKDVKTEKSNNDTNIIQQTEANNDTSEKSHETNQQKNKFRLMFEDDEDLNEIENLDIDDNDLINSVGAANIKSEPVDKEGENPVGNNEPYDRDKCDTSKEADTYNKQRLGALKSKIISNYYKKVPRDSFKEVNEKQGADEEIDLERMERLLNEINARSSEMSAPSEVSVASEVNSELSDDDSADNFDEKLLQLPRVALRPVHLSREWRHHARGGTLNCRNFSVKRLAAPLRLTASQMSRCKRYQRPASDSPATRDATRDATQRHRPSITREKLEDLDKISPAFKALRRKLSRELRLPRTYLAHGFWRSARNLAQLFVCRPARVRLARLPARHPKRVELPDIDEVRRINRTLRTAQVAPTTQTPLNEAAETARQTAVTDATPSDAESSGELAREPAAPLPSQEDLMKMIRTLAHPSITAMREADAALRAAREQDSTTRWRRERERRKQEQSAEKELDGDIRSLFEASDTKLQAQKNQTHRPKKQAVLAEEDKPLPDAKQEWQRQKTLVHKYFNFGSTRTSANANTNTNAKAKGAKKPDVAGNKIENIIDFMTISDEDSGDSSLKRTNEDADSANKRPKLDENNDADSDDDGRMYIDEGIQDFCNDDDPSTESTENNRNLTLMPASSIPGLAATHDAPTNVVYVVKTHKKVPLANSASLPSKHNWPIFTDRSKYIMKYPGTLTKTSAVTPPSKPGPQQYKLTMESRLQSVKPWRLVSHTQPGQHPRSLLKPDPLSQTQVAGAPELATVPTSDQQSQNNTPSIIKTTKPGPRSSKPGIQTNPSKSLHKPGPLSQTKVSGTPELATVPTSDQQSQNNNPSVIKTTKPGPRSSKPGIKTEPSKSLQKPGPLSQTKVAGTPQPVTLSTSSVTISKPSLPDDNASQQPSQNKTPLVLKITKPGPRSSQPGIKSEPSESLQKPGPLSSKSIAVKPGPRSYKMRLNSQMSTETSQAEVIEIDLTDDTKDTVGSAVTDEHNYFIKTEIDDLPVRVVRDGKTSCFQVGPIKTSPDSKRQTHKQPTVEQANDFARRASIQEELDVDIMSYDDDIQRDGYTEDDMQRDAEIDAANEQTAQAETDLPSEASNATGIPPRNDKSSSLLKTFQKILPEGIALSVTKRDRQNEDPAKEIPTPPARKRGRPSALSLLKNKNKEAQNTPKVIEVQDVRSLLNASQTQKDAEVSKASSNKDTSQTVTRQDTDNIPIKITAKTTSKDLLKLSPEELARLLEDDDDMQDYTEYERMDPGTSEQLMRNMAEEFAPAQMGPTEANVTKEVAPTQMHQVEKNVAKEAPTQIKNNKPNEFAPIQVKKERLWAEEIEMAKDGKFGKVAVKQEPDAEDQEGGNNEELFLQGVISIMEMRTALPDVICGDVIPVDDDNRMFTSINDLGKMVVDVAEFVKHVTDPEEPILKLNVAQPLWLLAEKYMLLTDENIAYEQPSYVTGVRTGALPAYTGVRFPQGTGPRQLLNLGTKKGRDVMVCGCGGSGKCLLCESIGAEFEIHKPRFSKVCRVCGVDPKRERARLYKIKQRPYRKIGDKPLKYVVVDTNRKCQVCKDGAQFVACPETLIINSKYYEKMSDEPLMYAPVLSVLQDVSRCARLVRREAEIYLINLRTARRHRILYRSDEKYASFNKAVQTLMSKMDREEVDAWYRRKMDRESCS